MGCGRANWLDVVDVDIDYRLFLLFLGELGWVLSMYISAIHRP